MFKYTTKKGVEKVSLSLYEKSNLVECDNCGRRIPTRIKKCAYCKAENVEYASYIFEKFLIVVIILIGFCSIPRTIEVYAQTQAHVQAQTTPHFKTIEATVTGYTSDESETDTSPFTTANQTDVREGIIACPRSIPFGTLVEVDGRQYECQDRMNKRFDDRFDIWFKTKAEAFGWGKRKVEIKIIQ